MLESRTIVESGHFMDSVFYMVNLFDGNRKTECSPFLCLEWVIFFFIFIFIFSLYWLPFLGVMGTATRRAEMGIDFNSTGTFVAWLSTSRVENEYVCFKRIWHCRSPFSPHAFRKFLHQWRNWSAQSRKMKRSLDISYLLRFTWSHSYHTISKGRGDYSNRSLVSAGLPFKDRPKLIEEYQ